MANSQEFIIYVRNQLRDFGEITTRTMFGGVGLLQRGAMFGLIHDDVLYFRADKASKGDYQSAGCRQFVFERPGTEAVAQMPYWTVPTNAFGHLPTLLEWAERAQASALKAKSARLA